MSEENTVIQYDENVKNFLSQKIILAHILVNSVKEFMGENPEDVVSLIEGSPLVTKVRLHPDGSVIDDFLVNGGSRIAGINTEDTSNTEGTIYYDIRFVVYTPARSERIKLILDVEAQNKFHPGYDIVTRGVYYCARMLSSQKETEFTKSDYDNIKKVYSIWICIDCPKEAQNTITEFSMRQKNIVGNYPDKRRYDLLSVVLVGLSDEIVQESDEYRLHRLLETFFSPSLSEQGKRKILEYEYGIPYSSEIERSVKEMCNASQKLIEQGISQGISQGLAQGISQGVSQLAKAIEDVRQYHYSFNELIEKGYTEEVAEAAIRLAQ